MTARTLASALAAVSLAGAAALGVATPALAQQYPPAAAGTISDSTVVAGQSVTVEAPADSFTPSTTVAVTIDALDISDTTVAAADGGARFTFTVPADAPAGDALVVFSAAGNTVTVPFTVLAGETEAPAQDAAPAEDAAPAQDEDRDEVQGSVLPRTGSDTIVPLTIAGVGLVGVGTALVVAARRRRESAPAGLA